MQLQEADQGQFRANHVMHTCMFACAPLVAPRMTPASAHALFFDSLTGCKAHRMRAQIMVAVSEKAQRPDIPADLTTTPGGDSPSAAGVISLLQRCWSQDPAGETTLRIALHTACTVRRGGKAWPRPEGCALQNHAT